MRTHILYILLLLAASLPMGACGGGADLSRPVKTATITFSTSSIAPLTETMELIIIEANLPKGASVTADPNIPGQIYAPTLRGPDGSNLSPTGSFITSANGVQTVRIVLVVNKLSHIPLGDFAILTCQIAPGSALVEADFINSNEPKFPDVQIERLLADQTFADFSGVTPHIKVAFSS